jgi:hypothetical protein
MALAEATHLVETIGTVELAKHILEVAADRREDGSHVSHGDPDGSPQLQAVSPELEVSDAKQTFAHQLGYASYVDLFESSMPVAGPDKSHWFVSAAANGSWVAWNEQSLDDSLQFGTSIQAVRHIKQQAC